jgi:MoxR-like ATPase
MTTLIPAIEKQLLSVVRGNPASVRMALAAVLAGGHVLLEDVPGVGKTTLARAMAKTLGVRFQRIQFTADLLPGDVVGTTIFRAESATVSFRPGPLFANVVLADEINRASPKTQSALLEAMAERQVSVDDTTHPLPQPFIVLATQNPLEHHGAYPLPESQLDRFLVRLSLGYPPLDDERDILVNNRSGHDVLAALPALLDESGLLTLQSQVQAVSLAPLAADYLLAIATATRTHGDVELAVSTRGVIGWAQLARALASMAGRNFVTPDDIKASAKPVIVHRLGLRGVVDPSHMRRRAEAVVDELLRSTPVPR